MSGDTQVPQNERAVHEQFEACRQFVAAFAETETYGGGRRAKIWLPGGQFLDATDAWKGERHALERLAERLLREMGVQEPLPDGLVPRG